MISVRMDLGDSNMFIKHTGQHKLSDDSLLAIEGNFMETRMSNWKRGEENILFTIP